MSLNMRLIALTLCLFAASPALGLRAADAAAPAVKSAQLFEGRPLAYWTSQAADRQAPLPTIVAALAKGVSAQEPNVQVQAADALQRLGPQGKAALPVLVKLLDHDHAWVSAAGQDALTAMGQEAVPAVVREFQQGSARVQLRAALVLGAIGPNAREALPALEQGREKATGEFRDRLTGVIATIRGEGGEAPRTAARARVTLTSTRTSQAEAVAGAAAGDWPQFHGPNRDAICTEKGLRTAWPEAGPPLLWQITGLGRGYSSVSIVGGKLFTMGDRKPADGEEAQYVLAYDVATQKELWATRIGPPHGDGGPRCTPTIADGMAYVVGTDGDLACLNADTGKVVWQKNFAKDFDGKMMSVWRFSESPLIDGNRLICTPGGKDATLVALDKRTGETIWKCAMPRIGDAGKDGAGYSSVVAAEIAGVRQYVQMLGRGVIGVEAATGRFLWGYNRVANGVANITAPVVRGDYVFASTSYKTGSALLHIKRDGAQWSADEVYFLGIKDFDNHHGGVILVGDYIYGGGGQNKGVPTCLKFASGAIAWKADPLSGGSAAVLYADGHIVFRYDRGLVALVEATPEAFRVKAQFTPVKGAGPAWPHPVIHQGKLYLRHGDILACYDLRTK